ncbi:amino-acid N-acetyltransferase [Neisseria leonii]|uniref:Amino-acid acetyltransferase n=1 Tax=Neisseria leonii TaxID=2995413 RepID=A0A9X4IDX1_9NEIS|nr:amino-acid N-acetyltransferase [Neisseria sp. 51.81]MDD9327568.1 amino-acid N-acetyltransferase [Neisseria sp. 51.81]
MHTASVFVRDFREAAPYIHYLRGKTLVIGLASALLDPPVLRALAADLNLLSGLGVRLVLVHGSRRQINRLTEAAGHTPRYHRNRRITDETALAAAKQACGLLRADIEAALSAAMSQSPQRGLRPNTASGNYLSARPYGIIDGIDMGYTGRVRKIDADSIRRHLDHAVVLISPLGASLGGQTYNLSMTDIARDTAVALGAEKLIFLTEQDGILDRSGGLISNLSAPEARKLLADGLIDAAQTRVLEAAVYAVENGVARSQILSGLADGGLIGELFTRNGTGTSLSNAPFMNIRAARNRDIPHITALIRPLEAAGILRPRSRRYLEEHIREFWVLEHDRHIYGCAALKHHGKTAELACLAVSPDTQDSGYGEHLLKHIAAQARAGGADTLFALTTHTGDWFAERGFQTASPEELPPQRLAEYRENGRRSKIFKLVLS